MKPFFLIVGVLLLYPGFALATESAQGAYHIEADISDVKSLQRGARIFVNTCMGCHSASYMRYNRLGADLGISEQVLKNNLMFGTDKPGSTMDIAMRGSDAIRFFGVAPPDLSVIARSRGADWLYAYFMTFYRDPERPFGVNNLTFRDVAMPHVLWELQGYQRPVYKTFTHPDGSQTKVLEKLEMETPDAERDAAYRRTIYDLINFLVYLSEPAKMQRQKIGVWVILYLLAFLALAYLLKKEYWKDVS